LTRVSITTEHPTNTKAPSNSNYLAKLFNMLDQCPQLQDLRIARQIRGAMLDVSGFLANMSWPRLRCLILSGCFTFSAPKTVTAFFGRHPQLEILSLPESVDLPTLPYLRYVSTPSFSNGTSMATAAQLPCLEFLSMIPSFGTETDTNAIIGNFVTFPSLRGTTLALLTVHALEALSRAVLQLERLAFQTSPWNTDVWRATKTSLVRLLPMPNRISADRPTPPFQTSPECIALLTTFAHLKHLDSRAVINDEDADADATLDMFLCALAVVPQLTCVGVDWKYPTCHFPCLRWFSIVRDTQGVYAGCKEVRRLRCVKFRDWEDVFCVPGLEL
jgi:hypothetical protein